MRLALILSLVASTAAAQDLSEAKGAVLRGLDKVSGVTQDLEVESGASVAFGRLEIDLSDCRYPANDPSSNAYAHLVIRDKLAKDPSFDGWMIASSPALNALDHPRYDVWLLRCKTTDPGGASN